MKGRVRQKSQSQVCHTKEKNFAFPRLLARDCQQIKPEQLTLK
jgi:hypothetical protein